MHMRKAWIAAGLAALGALLTAYLDRSVTWEEWLAVIGAGMAALGAVYKVTNLPPSPAPRAAHREP